MTERASLSQSHEAFLSKYTTASPDKRFDNLINRFVSDKLARQAIGQTIASELLYDPSQLAPFYARYQSKLSELAPRHQKDFVALKGLDETLSDQIPQQIRYHFFELVSSPLRMGQLIDMNMAAATETSTKSLQEFGRETKNNPDLQAKSRANQMLLILFEQAGKFEKTRSNGGIEPVTPSQMKEVQKKMVDLMYSCSLHAVSQPQNQPAHTFVWSVASGLVSHISHLNRPEQGLLHAALYSDEPETVAKALYVEFVARFIDQYQGRNGAFDGSQDAVRDSHRTALRFKQMMAGNNPMAVKNGDELAENIKNRLVQKSGMPADDIYYLDPAITPLESEVLQYNPRMWYDFLRFYSAFSQAKSIPVTLPDGIFRGIGHADGGNEERAIRVTETAWNTKEKERVTNHLAIEDAFRLLTPPAIAASVKLDAGASAIIRTGAIPLDIQLGANKFSLQIGADGRLYFQDGEPVDTKQGNGSQWLEFVTATARPAVYQFLEKNDTELPAELIPQLARFMKPELKPASFAGVERLLDETKERLADPKRGLLAEGITAKIMKDQIPGVSPITRIHFDQTGSVATVSIGKTKLTAKIDLHASPPQVVNVNGYMLNRNLNEDVWLEYVILAPLKSIACPDPAVPEEKDDSLLLEGTENLTRLQAIRKTHEVIRRNVGHLYQLPVRGGRPARYTEHQRQKVLMVENPLIGVPILDLETYNETHRDPKDPVAPFWDYAIYTEASYEQHQPRHAVVMVPHAYDGMEPIIAGEKAAQV